MKIKLHRLRELYQSSIAEPVQMNRENCPSLKILFACIHGQASRKNKKRILEHITQCKSCLEEFQVILDIMREQKKFIQKIYRHFNSHSKKNISKESKIHSRILLNYRKLAYLSAGSVFVLALGFALILFFNRGLEQKFRGANNEFIKLTQPIRNKTIKIPIVFHWKRIDNVDYYILELFDNTLFPIWKSQEIHTNRIMLPKDITISLSSDISYYWFVTGYLTGEKKIESSLEQFQINKR